MVLCSHTHTHTQTHRMPCINLNTNYHQQHTLTSPACATPPLIILITHTTIFTLRPQETTTIKLTNYKHTQCRFYALQYVTYYSHHSHVAPPKPNKTTEGSKNNRYICDIDIEALTVTHTHTLVLKQKITSEFNIPNNIEF